MTYIDESGVLRCQCGRVMQLSGSPFRPGILVCPQVDWPSDGGYGDGPHETITREGADHIRRVQAPSRVGS